MIDIHPIVLTAFFVSCMYMASLWGRYEGAKTVWLIVARSFDAEEVDFSERPYALYFTKEDGRRRSSYGFWDDEE